MNNYETLLCAAFVGTGKSYLCKNSKDTYMEIECWRYRKKDFPENYIRDIVKSIGKTKYLFISTDPIVLKKLNEMNIDIQLFYPKNELRNEYLDRFINRDSSNDFIGILMKNWNIWLDELKEQKYCKHTILKTGQYLQDVIK